MDTAQRIREQGFRRWYERRLNEAHLSLVTCLLCMVTAAVCIEAFADQPGAAAKAMLVAAVVTATAVAVLAWRRFQSALVYAESIAGQATCRACGAYAKWEITSNGGESAAAADSPVGLGRSGLWLRVRCRKCGEQWQIE